MSSELAANPSTHSLVNPTAAEDQSTSREHRSEVVTRAEAFAHSPLLARLVGAISSQLAKPDEAAGLYKKPISGAALHPSRELQSLLQDDTVGPETLVVVLPAEFEPVLSQLIAQELGAFNYRTVDLQYNLTYFAYSVTLPGQAYVCEIWLAEHVLCSPLCECGPLYCREGAEDGVGKRMAVIMTAGDSVAIGGFPVDDELLGRAQAASMSARTAMPEELYSQAELDNAAALAKETGAVPWMNGYWPVWDSNTSGSVPVVATEAVFVPTKPQEIPIPILHLADHPVVQRLQKTLRRQLTRQWPTRHLSLCPPACATLVDTASLRLPSLEPAQAHQTLVVSLPADFEPHLRDLAFAIPDLLIHDDISLLARHAYLSWSVSAPRGELPKTLWVKVRSVVPSFLHNELAVGVRVLPIVFLAGQSLVAGGFTPDDDMFLEWEASLRTCETTPRGHSQQELARAKGKAQKYSDQPWLFMRYELNNGNRHLAVNWAPVEQLVQ